jgi:AcrR family transcriptional regulator
MTSLTEKGAPRPGGRGARTRILNAAFELFYFEGSTPRALTDRSKASVSKRILYHHFPSKTALVEEYLR